MLVRSDKGGYSALKVGAMGRLSVFISAISFTLVLASAGAGASEVTSPTCVLNLQFQLPQSIEELHLLDEALAQEEREFLTTHVQNPAAHFLKLRRLALASKREDGDFSFEPHSVILKRALIDLRLRQMDGLSPEHQEKIARTMDHAKELLSEGSPYKAVHRFIFYEYLAVCDQLFLQQHPHLTGRFHFENAEHVLEKMLARGPDRLMFFSFQDVDPEYFATTRGAPLDMIGLHTQGSRPGEPIPYADGFPMMPSEFSWHDVGHIEFMAMRDFAYLDFTFKPIERVVQEWDLSRRRIGEFWKSFAADVNLYDAMALILFEILHERGYQYSFSVLKSQLDTPKWTEILIRKRDNNYFSNWPNFNFDVFDRLDEARRELLRFLNETRIKDQLLHIQAHQGFELEMRVVHTPRVGYAQANLVRLRIIEPHQIEVDLIDPQGQPYVSDNDHMILAQVNPVRVSPFTDAVVAKIEALFATGGVGPSAGRWIEVSNSGELFVSSSQERTPLDQIDISPGTHPNLLEKRRILQMRQVLGSFERNTPLSFTIEKTERTLIGVLEDRGLIRGERAISVRTHDGRVEILPLSEIRVDPLQKADFDQMGRQASLPSKD